MPTRSPPISDPDAFLKTHPRSQRHFAALPASHSRFDITSASHPLTPSCRGYRPDIPPCKTVGSPPRGRAGGTVAALSAKKALRPGKALP